MISNIFVCRILGQDGRILNETRIGLNFCFLHGFIFQGTTEIPTWTTTTTTMTILWMTTTMEAIPCSMGETAFLTEVEVKEVINQNELICLILVLV